MYLLFGPMLKIKLVKSVFSAHKYTTSYRIVSFSIQHCSPVGSHGGSVAEWLACWTQALKGLCSNRSRDGNSLRQTVHIHRDSVHQAAKLVAALLKVARVTAGLAESYGSLPPDL